MIATSLRTKTQLPQQTSASGMESSRSQPPQKQPPTLADFLVPSNQIEHNLILARLVNGGSLPAKAEQVIAGGKTAFNKALREYKKEHGTSQDPRKDPETVNTSILNNLIMGIKIATLNLCLGLQSKKNLVKQTIIEQKMIFYACRKRK